MLVGIEQATGGDIATIIDFIYTNGDNGLNDLDPRRTLPRIALLATGHTGGLMAYDKFGLAAVVTYGLDNNFNKYVVTESVGFPQGEVLEIVVRQNLTARGLGTQLFGMAINALQQTGAKDIFATHHVENTASARIMSKNRLHEVDRFEEERASGLRITVVRGLLAQNNA